LHWRTYNLTTQCLDSLAESNYANYQVYVIDNGSQDGSLERLQEAYPWVQTYSYQQNLGFAAGMNPAMRRALEQGSDYVLLLNSDVLVPPELLQELAAAAEANPQIGILSPKTLWKGREEYLAGLGCRVRAFDLELIGWDVLDQPSTSREPVVIESAFGSAMFLSRRMLERVGLFDERFFFYYEDIDLCLRAKEHGFLAAYLPHVAVRHAVSASVRSVRGLRDFYMARSRQLFFRKYRRGLWRLGYICSEAYNLLYTIYIRLKEGSPSNALGYFAGVLTGLIMPVEAPLHRDQTTLQ
jgi:GT2 family glycosyltransferase